MNEVMSVDENYVVPPGKVLILRTCDKDLKSYGGFQWPASGPVEATDWKPIAQCGNGLHGFARGEGDGSLASFDESAVWIVAEVDESNMIDLGGKVKFPSPNVIYSGSRLVATNLIAKHYPLSVVVGATVTGGDGATVTGGYRATVTGGYGAILVVRWWNESAQRYRVSVGYPGDSGILPNSKYKLDPQGNFIPA